MENLKEYLSYMPETGDIVWAKSPGKKTKAGSIAGYLSSKSGPYRRVMFRRKLYMQHRIAWFLYHGTMPVGDIDHKNGNKTDNRISNLRDVTRSENQQNRIKPVKNCKSGVFGVSWSAQYRKWKAKITVNGESVYLGRFGAIKDAENAYLKAKNKLHLVYADGVGLSNRF